MAEPVPSKVPRTRTASSVSKDHPPASNDQKKRKKRGRREPRLRGSRTCFKVPRYGERGIGGVADVRDLVSLCVSVCVGVRLHDTMRPTSQYSCFFVAWWRASLVAGDARASLLTVHCLPRLWRHHRSSADKRCARWVQGEANRLRPRRREPELDREKYLFPLPRLGLLGGWAGRAARGQSQRPLLRFLVSATNSRGFLFCTHICLRIGTLHTP